MAGHYHRTFDVRCIQPQIADQGFGKTLHREFCGAVGGMRHRRSERAPEAVDTRGVDDMARVSLQQHRHEDARSEIDPAPADSKSPLPLLAGAGEQAAAAADAGVVEQQMDLVGLVLLGDLVAEAQELRFVRDVGEVRGDPQSLRHPLDLAKPLGFRHR
jgi:hypothetical protein